MRKIAILLMLLSAVLLRAEQASDELNAVDDRGRKIGYWVVTGADKPTKGYTREAVIEEGTFETNKKQGLWKRYYPNGKLLSEINYANNIPNGAYKTYYETGKLEEQGHWSFNKNVGEFKRFHPNGKPSQEFTFAENGLRNGEQRYFHENGQLELKVTVTNGKEEGVSERYFANGDLKERKEFSDGVMSEGSRKTHEMKAPEVIVEETPAVEVKVTTVVKEDKPNLSVFKHTGKNTLYNRNKQVTQSGYFKNGRLMDGRWNRYDSNGIIEAIEIYKGGKLIGHAPLEDGK